MFYCNECAKKKHWPQSIFISYGPCEVCGKTADCNSIHHSLLSDPRKQEKANQPLTNGR